MARHIDVLVVPEAPAEQLVRAAAQAKLGEGARVLVLVPLATSLCTVVRLYDQHRQPVTEDMEALARAVSMGPGAVGRAQLDPAEGTRSWQRYERGAVSRTVTMHDELFIPHDAQGRPDIDAEPRRRADGVPEGWRLLRSCLDLGMDRLVSCRFGPVARALDRLHSQDATGVRAFLLATDKGPLRPAQELPWSALET